MDRFLLILEIFLPKFADWRSGSTVPLPCDLDLLQIPPIPDLTSETRETQIQARTPCSSPGTAADDGPPFTGSGQSRSPRPELGRRRRAGHAIAARDVSSPLRNGVPANDADPKQSASHPSSDPRGLLRQPGRRDDACLSAAGDRLPKAEQDRIAAMKIERALQPHRDDSGPRPAEPA